MLTLHKIFRIFVVFDPTLYDLQHYFDCVVDQKHQINDDILTKSQRRNECFEKIHY